MKKMNVDNGHLIKLMEKSGEIQIPDGYEQVPEKLNRAALRKLAGKDEAQVSLTSGGKLSRWASKQRKHKRQIAKQSKQQNR